MCQPVGHCARRAWRSLPGVHGTVGGSPANPLNFRVSLPVLPQARWLLLPPFQRSREDRMDPIRNRLEQDLKTAVRRLREVGGAVAIEDVARTVGDGNGFADEMDSIQANERREIEFATRELLVDRVRRLGAALERLDDGEYGICVECEEPIAPARLKAMPEVLTCVRCQDRLERYGRALAAVEADPGMDNDD